MTRVVLVCILFGALLSFDASSQISTKRETTEYAYYHPSRDKESWQRLNLLLSSTFIVVAKEGQVEHDTCLYIASRHLGLSRYAVLAEGFGDAALLKESAWVDRQEPGMAIRRLPGSTGRKRLQLLLLLGSYYAFQPASYYTCKDSVEYYLGKAVEESTSLNEGRLGRIALCLLGKIYAQANDHKGDSIYTALIDQCRQAGDKETEARAFAYRGIYTAPLRETFQKKVTDLQTAAGLYHRLGNTEWEIHVLTDLGYMLVVSGRFDAAYETFFQALELAKGIHYPYVHYNTDALSMITNFQGKFGEPLLYNLQSIRIAESCRDSIGWAHFYTRLSEYYNLEGRWEDCYDMAHKAIGRYVINRDPEVFGILGTVVEKMCREGRSVEALDLVMDISNKVSTRLSFTDQFHKYDLLATCYLSVGKFDLADMCIKKMDSLETKAESIRGPVRRYQVNKQLALLFLKQGQYRKAKEFFGKLVDRASATSRSLNVDLYAYESLIHVDSVLGDHGSLASHYRKYTQLLDSNFKVTKLRQAEELQVVYETKDKENQIALLNKQATQALLIKNLMLAGIAAVLIIAGLLYRQNRLKQKSNKVITDKNEQLQGLLTDREWLLKEIHHRVKNNLQIVTSLLSSQAVYINNEAALTAIKDSKRRVYAMSLIHQKLYQSKNIATIGMYGYISELVIHVQDSLGTRNRIVFELDIEPLELDVSQAIPLGLIINECVVNSIKYAFPDDRRGTVRISLQHDGTDHLRLDIKDNGIGLPADFNIMEQNSLGLDLVRGLAKQLKGRFHIENDQGLHVTIGFAVLRKQIQEESSINH